jgi:hypothetical protein
MLSKTNYSPITCIIHIIKECYENRTIDIAFPTNFEDNTNINRLTRDYYSSHKGMLPNFLNPLMLRNV